MVGFMGRHGSDPYDAEVYFNALQKAIKTGASSDPRTNLDVRFWILDVRIC